MTQIRFVIAGFLLPTLLFAVSSLLRAAPIEHRSINKSVKDFPEKTDLSSPESAMAAWCRAYARQDIAAMPGLLGYGSTSGRWAHCRCFACCNFREDS
jgi:hypothetical protein